MSLTEAFSNTYVNPSHVVFPLHSNRYNKIGLEPCILRMVMVVQYPAYASVNQIPSILSVNQPGKYSNKTFDIAHAPSAAQYILKFSRALVIVLICPAQLPGSV
eukprot:67914_1